MQPGSAVSVTSTAQVITAGKGAIYRGAHLAAGAGAAATLKLYHGTADTDPLIATLAAVQSTGDDDSCKGGVSCPNGIYAVLAGTGAGAVVHIG